MSKITPCLWFDGQAEEAAELYTSLFPDSRIDGVQRSPADNPSTSKGEVITVDFTVAGQKFIGLNGGPEFKFNEAVSLEIICDDQAEVDYYWGKLTAGGDPAAQQCGWLKDKFGVSWQVVPKGWEEMLNHPDKTKRERAFEVMLGMKKLDLAELQRAVA